MEQKSKNINKESSFLRISFGKSFVFSIGLLTFKIHSIYFLVNISPEPVTDEISLLGKLRPAFKRSFEISFIQSIINNIYSPFKHNI